MTLKTGPGQAACDKAFLRQKAEEMEEKRQDAKEETSEAYWKGQLNIFSSAVDELDQSDFEDWLEEKMKSAKDGIDEGNLLVHMLCYGERDAVKEICDEVLDDKTTEGGGSE